MKNSGILLLLILLSVICNKFAFGETINEAIGKQEKALLKANDREKVEIYVKLSDLKLSNLLPGAADDAGRAFVLANSQNDPELIAVSAIQYAACYLLDIRGVDSAILLLNTANDNLRKAGKSNPAEYYSCLSKYYLYLNDLPSAISNARLAEELAMAKSDLITCGISRIVLAKALKAQNNRTMFLQYIKLASSAFNESHDYLRSGGYFISISILLGDAGFSELALQNAVKGLSICEHSYDSIPLGFLYANLSGLFSMNDKQKGIEYLQKSLTIFNTLNYKKGISYTSNMLGMYYFGEKQYSKSIESFQTTLKLSIETNDLLTASFACNNLAEVMINQNKFSEAEKYLNESKTLADKSGDPFAQAVYHSAKGLYYRHSKQLQKSIAEYQTSLDFSYKIQNANFVIENLKIIADVYHLMGNEKKALDYYNNYMTARDSVANLALIDKASDIRDNYLAEKEETKSDQSKSFDRYIVGIIVLIITLALVFLAGTAVLKRKKVNRKQKATELMKDAALLAKEISEPKTPKLQLNEMLQKELWEKLLHLMDSERIYRNADLSLAELAEKLNSNTTYVSKIINDLGDSNFTTFINRYRIREACNLLTDPDSSYLSIEGIALTVGFHSKSAFNGAFKKYTGKTPSEFAGLNATGS